MTLRIFTNVHDAYASIGGIKGKNPQKKIWKKRNTLMRGTFWGQEADEPNPTDRAREIARMFTALGIGFPAFGIPNMKGVCAKQGKRGYTKRSTC